MVSNLIYTSISIKKKYFETITTDCSTWMCSYEIIDEFEDVNQVLRTDTDTTTTFTLRRLRKDTGNEN